MTTGLALFLDGEVSCSLLVVFDGDVCLEGVLGGFVFFISLDLIS